MWAYTFSKKREQDCEEEKLNDPADYANSYGAKRTFIIQGLSNSNDHGYEHPYGCAEHYKS